MRSVTAIVLGGGRGTRLRPLTLKRAKPAVAFAGQYRLIDIPISNCINSGIKRIFVLTQFLSASLHRHIMQTYQFDKFTDGFVDILATEQTQQQEKWYDGSADSVRGKLEHTMAFDAEQVLILASDHLYRMDYSDFISEHRKSGADVTIGAALVPERDAFRMGLLQTGQQGSVSEYIEKSSDPDVLRRFRATDGLLRQFNLPQGTQRYLASMGIYVFNRNILSQILGMPGMSDFGHHVIPLAVENHRVKAYLFDDYFKDIGTIPDYFEASLSLVRPDPPFRIWSPVMPFYTRTRSLPPCRVVRSEIHDSLLGEGSDIQGASISESIVGLRTMVRGGSRLSRVIVLGSDFYDGDEKAHGYSESMRDLPPLGIGQNCSIENTIVDKNARIGDDVIIHAQPDSIEMQTDSYWIRDGITVITTGAVIPSGTKI